MEPTPAPKMSKRAFLFGAAAGGGALQAARWAAPSVFDNADPKPPPPHQVSYAQSGEDLVVSYIFREFGLAQPSYIDIGAYDPIEINNTYLFYTRGARGLLIEPNVDMIPALKKERPGDTVLNIGIGLTDATEADYYRMSVPSWNTFDKDMVDHYLKVSNGGISVKEVVKIPLVNINEVLARHYGGKTPDFFSVDVEGLEAAILQSLDWSKHRPKVVCLETLVAGTKQQKSGAAEFLAGKGYAVRGSSFVNTVFVDKTLLG